MCSKNLDRVFIYLKINAVCLAIIPPTYAMENISVKYPNIH